METSEGEITHEMREAARAALRTQAREEHDVHALESRGHAAAVLGTVDGGRVLSFDESACVFLLGGRMCMLEDVRALDARAQVRWRFLEQRDWMRRLDARACAAAFERELDRLGAVGGSAGLDEQIRQHVKKDDSYLHGHLVDTEQEEAAEAVAEAVAKAAEAQAEVIDESVAAHERGKGQETSCFRQDSAWKSFGNQDQAR